jgi:phenylacetate-coenzyme A ligase PaaK-like adenylate-forming protein
MTEPLRTLRTAWDIWRTGRAGGPAIASRQRARLPELVTFARERSPYYRRLYKGLPARVTDVRQLPVVTKPELMRNFDEWVTDPAVTKEEVEAFVADESLVGSPYLGHYLAATTSGTTGDPAIFLHDEGALAVYNAIGYVRAMPALLSRHELSRLLRGGARAAAIYATGGHFFAVAVLERRLRVRPWRARMQRIFSVLAPLDELVGDLNAFGPAMLASYPSMLEVLAREQQAGRLKIRPVMVSAGGETLTPEVRGRIEAAFGCPVRDVYGSSEAVGVTYECGQRWLHVSADWYVLEPVDEDYNPTPPGEPSRTVLVTNLANRVQPIIRYDQGDSVTVRADACPCGSPLPAIRVVGRTNDTLSFRTVKGREVRLLPLALGTVIEETPGVRRFRAVETAPRVLSLRLDAEPGANLEKVWEAVASRLKEYLSALGLDRVSVERSTQQPQPNPASGKFRQVWAEA